MSYGQGFSYDPSSSNDVSSVNSPMHSNYTKTHYTQFLTPSKEKFRAQYNTTLTHEIIASLYNFCTLLPSVCIMAYLLSVIHIPILYAVNLTLLSIGLSMIVASFFTPYPIYISPNIALCALLVFPLWIKNDYRFTEILVFTCIASAITASILLLHWFNVIKSINIPHCFHIGFSLGATFFLMQSALDVIGVDILSRRIVSTLSYTSTWIFLFGALGSIASLLYMPSVGPLLLAVTVAILGWTLPARKAGAKYTNSISWLQQSTKTQRNLIKPRWYWDLTGAYSFLGFSLHEYLIIFGLTMAMLIVITDVLTMMASNQYKKHLPHAERCLQSTHNTKRLDNDSHDDRSDDKNNNDITQSQFKAQYSLGRQPSDSVPLLGRISENRFPHDDEVKDHTSITVDHSSIFDPSQNTNDNTSTSKKGKKRSQQQHIDQPHTSNEQFKKQQQWDRDQNTNAYTHNTDNILSPDSNEFSTPNTTMMSRSSSSLQDQVAQQQKRYNIANESAYRHNIMTNIQCLITNSICSVIGILPFTVSDEPYCNIDMRALPPKSIHMLHASQHPQRLQQQHNNNKNMDTMSQFQQTWLDQNHNTGQLYQSQRGRSSWTTLFIGILCCLACSFSWLLVKMITPTVIAVFLYHHTLLLLCRTHKLILNGNYKYNAAHPGSNFYKYRDNTLPVSSSSSSSSSSLQSTLQRQSSTSSIGSNSSIDTRSRGGLEMPSFQLHVKDAISALMIAFIIAIFGDLGTAFLCGGIVYFGFGLIQRIPRLSFEFMYPILPRRVVDWLERDDSYAPSLLDDDDDIYHTRIPQGPRNDYTMV